MQIRRLGAAPAVYGPGSGRLLTTLKTAGASGPAGRNARTGQPVDLDPRIRKKKICHASCILQQRGGRDRR